MQLNELEERFPHHRLRIHLPDGDARCLGESGPILDWHIRKRHTLKRILRKSGRWLGDSYVAQEWDIAPEHLPLLVRRLSSRPGRAPRPDWPRRLRERLPARRPREALLAWLADSPLVSRHCLGASLCHRCAHFPEPGISLEQAQRHAWQRVLEKLALQAGQHVFIADAGWGALALYLAERADVRVTATCHSGAQLQQARAAARRRGLDARIDFRLGGPQAFRNGYDRLVLGGLRGPCSREPVSRLLHACSMLKTDGIALLTIVGVDKGALAGNQWLRRRMQCGRNTARLSRLAADAESGELHIRSVVNQGAHYRQTFGHWRRRLQYHREAVSRAFGEHRTRSWEFELASLEAAFADGEMIAWEVLLGSGTTAGQAVAGKGESLDHAAGLATFTDNLSTGPRVIRN